MTDAQLDAKFRTLAGDGLSKARVKKLLETLWALDEVPNIGQTIALTKIRSRTLRR